MSEEVSYTYLLLNLANVSTTATAFTSPSVSRFNSAFAGFKGLDTVSTTDLAFKSRIVSRSV